jgi:hypothetical protein
MGGKGIKDEERKYKCMKKARRLTRKGRYIG